MTDESNVLVLPPNDGRKTRVIACANGSAGSGKSTFATAVGAAAAERGKRVLVIGMDKQRDTSHLLGYDDPDADENLATLYDVIDGLCTLDEAVVPARQGEGGKVIPRLWLVLESRELEGLEYKLAAETAREMWLYRMMKQVRGRFDVVLLDCPGDVKLATIGALLASDEIVGCVKAQEKEARGLTELEDKITGLHESFSHLDFPKEVTWVVIAEAVSNASQGKVYSDIEDQVRESWGDIVLQPSVRRDVKVPEAYTASMPVTLYAPTSEAALAYRKIGRKMKLFR